MISWISRNMKFKLMVFYVFFLGDINYVKLEKLRGPTDTTIAEFPYLAMVSGKSLCPGILITEKYIVVQASCVTGVADVSVYLGLSKWPPSNYMDEKTQFFISANVTIHEEYVELIEEMYYLNNIALIKLPKPVILNKFVRPANLVSNEEIFEQEIIVVSGWRPNYSNMQSTTMQLLNQDTCSYFYGTKFLQNQQLCAKSTSANELYTGNAIIWNSGLIGYIVKRYTCMAEEADCGKVRVIFNLVPFLNWISQKTNISIKELSGRSQEKDINVALNTIENLENIKIKYERNLTNINQKITNIFDELRENTNKQISKSEEFEKQLDDMEAEILNIRNKENQRDQQQEEINNLTAEISNMFTTKSDMNKVKINLERQFKTISKEIYEKINKMEAKHEQDTANINENIKNIMKEITNKQLRFAEELHKQFKQIGLMSEEIESIKDSINEIREYMENPIAN